MGGRGTSSGFAKQRPTVGAQIAQNMDHSERVDWVQSVTGWDQSYADEVVRACEYYSGSGYKNIHNGSNAEKVKLIDSLLNHPDVPQYRGTVYRGLEFTPRHGMSADDQIMSIINGGVWKEPGITSFSIDMATAKSFASTYTTKDSKTDRSVILESENQIGVPFRHLSNLSFENEILTPSSVKKNGWAITDWRREGNTYYLKIKER